MTFDPVFLANLTLVLTAFAGAFLVALWVGMNPSKTNNNGHISRASQIIRDRIYLLNLEQKSSARFEVINHPGSGVTVHIYLPIIHSRDIQ
jgi:hypothetical protein